MMQHAIAALRFYPTVPLWLLVPLAAICVGAIAVGLWLRARGALWRAASFAVIIAWLAGPSLVQETRQGLASIGLLVIDQSGSMQVGQRTVLAEKAAASIRAQAAALPGLELRSITVPEAGHEGTQLWAATTRALADIPPERLAGIIAITDGQVHDLPASLPAAAPLHALIPAAGEEWDRRVRILQAPGYGLVGHSVDISVMVEDLGPPGSAPPGPAQLTIQRDGGASTTMEVQPGQAQTIPIDITRAGPTLVKLSTDAVPGEASALNNQTVVQINGVRDRLRVLLVSGEPNQGERSWRRLLKSDPAVDLVHFTILRPPEKDDTTPLSELALIAFPTRQLFQEKLSGFDLIILDRFTDRGILPHVYLRNIADYVRKGGALLLVVGPEFAGAHSLDQTPLSDVLPVHAPLKGATIINQQFTPALTDLGRRHPVTENLPGAEAAKPDWGPWYRLIAGEDVSGQVLMTADDNRPLLVLNHVDKGRAAMLMSDQIWLWSASGKDGGPQAELLRRTAHWLMKEPDLDEERLSASIEGSKLHIERRSVAGQAAATVTITPPSGPDVTAQLKAAGQGVASTVLEAPAPGIWQVSDGEHFAFAAAGLNNPLEYADLRATAGPMAPLINSTGGGTIWLAHGMPTLREVGPSADAAGSSWIGLRNRQAHMTTGITTLPLLPPWLALSLLLAITLVAWRQESR